MTRMRLESVHELRVDDLSKGPVGRPPQLGGPGHMRLDDSPFGIGQVGFVTESRAAILLAGGRGPHEVLQEASATPWNPIDPDHSTSHSRVTTSLQPEHARTEFRNRAAAQPKLDCKAPSQSTGLRMMRAALRNPPP